MSSQAATNTPIRIAQWTTGNVGRQAVKRIVERPDMELVGLYAYSEDKVGRDVGELAGLGRTLGVAATDDIDEIIALRPDCVSYMPLVPDIGVMARLLGAGINIVTTSEFLTGRAHGDEAVATLRRAAQAGSASVFGSGINPGWIEYVAAVASSPCRVVERVRITESYNLSLMAADANMDDFGWGRPAGDPGHARDIEDAVFEFRDAADRHGQPGDRDAGDQRHPGGRRRARGYRDLRRPSTRRRTAHGVPVAAAELRRG